MSAALVRRVLAAMPVIDGHNDLPTALRARAGYSVAGLDGHRPELHTDIPRLRAGGVGGQFWSVYVPSHLPEPEAVAATLEQIDAVYRLAATYPETFTIAYTAADTERVIREGRIASLIGVEGGHSLAGSLGVLRSFARLGVRYLTLTHNDNTAWADSATDKPAVGGLTDVGRAIVTELNRLGILVDLSHVAASTQRDALDASTAPVIFSHSSARSVNDHPRNVADPELHRLRTNGGVVQLTFVPAFVSADVAEWTLAALAERQRLDLPVPWTWPRAPRPGESAAAVRAEAVQPPADDRFSRWLAAHPRPAVSLAQVADHVDHARDVAGVAHVGLGGDYDGVDWLPAELADVSGYPRLLGELADRGWSGADLEALTGRNILRVLRDAEDVAEAPLWPVQPVRSARRPLAGSRRGRGRRR
ncbi:dipeptidase [Dactylosporangium cerinum]|uniref:Dipeptidase n=1 Tax=Dactylosporangium cerinum TaxID=1434730 RepID=A0ABV9WGS7_9ACTN